MRVATESDWAIVQEHIASHIVKFPPGVPREMPGYWDGVWMLSSNEACSMYWKESENDVRMILVWNSTKASSYGAKELVGFAKRYSKKPIIFSTYSGVSDGTRRAFEKWGFVPDGSDENWMNFRYAS